MEGYVRFSSSSPPANPSNHSQSRFAFQDTPSIDSSADSGYPDSPQQQVVGASSGTWGRNMWGNSLSWMTPPPLPQFLQRWRTPSPRAYQSNYMTLVPLSDDRLKPRRTKLIVGSVCVLALLAIIGVFVCVPRGINVGTISVSTTKMTFNSTTKTYRIILQADVPIYNPNYLKASVSGNLTVSFYDAEAGWGALGPALLPARTNPQMLSVKVDASNLPQRYTRVVYDQCFNFPRILVLFLLGTFHTTYLGYKTTLPSVDTYFMLDCSGARDLSMLDSSSHADDDVTTDIFSQHVSTGTSWDRYSEGLQPPALTQQQQQQQQETRHQQHAKHMQGPHAVWLAQQRHSSHLVKQPGDRTQALLGLQQQRGQQRQDRQQQEQRQSLQQQQQQQQQRPGQQRGDVTLQDQQR